MLKRSRQHRTFKTGARAERRCFWQPSMASDYRGGGPRKPEKKPSKQELAENALRHAKYLTREEVASQKKLVLAKSEAIRLAVEAGENLEQAEKRITKILHAVRRQELGRDKKR